MPSPSHDFQASSPVYGTGRRKSQFTYRQLGLLASYSTASPLRVIAHIDLDAFYAQCGEYRASLKLASLCPYFLDSSVTFNGLCPV
jgi:DNA polymerase eta